MSADRKATFVELCLAGRAKPGEVDDYVDLWHDGSSSLPLHEFLGLTWEEYGAWVEDSDKIVQILAARREKKSRSPSNQKYKLGQAKLPKSAAEKTSVFSQSGRRKGTSSPSRRPLKVKAN